MKIIYKQQNDLPGSLERFDISNCYLKRIQLNRDRSVITKKLHQHTDFEMHIIRQGSQQYMVGRDTYQVEKSHFLLIAPNVTHQALDAAENTEKYAITFQMPFDGSFDCFFGQITSRMEENLAFIANEAALRRDISHTLIGNTLLEILVSVLRLAGQKEKTRSIQQEENPVIAFAKQYIADNIDRAPGVTEVAAYCYLSNKQFTRLFSSAEGVSPGEYILRQRVQRIEKLLRESDISLKEISRKMHFGSEHYLNAFFKKYAGMPPGEYRKMQGK